MNESQQVESWIHHSIQAGNDRELIAFIPVQVSFEYCLLS